MLLRPPQVRKFGRLLGVRTRLIDSYVLAQLAPPMIAAVVVIMVVLLLYRMLDIFTVMAGSTARFSLVPRMIADLAPQYLGLAAPGAFFLGVFLVVARMSDTSEVDALLASGLSLARFSAPFLVTGAVVALINLLVLGFAQPIGRYGFNAHLNYARNAPWDATLQPRDFVRAGDTAMITADKVDITGRVLAHVVIRRVEKDGREQVFTASRGVLNETPDQRRVAVSLENGQVFAERVDGEPTVGAFSRLSVDVDLQSNAAAFRARGREPREMTLFELPVQARTGTPEQRRRAEAELQMRIVRTLSTPLLVLIGVPAGIAAKRRKRALGALVCGVTLFLYENAIDTGQHLADAGNAPPMLALWTPFVVFGLLSLALFGASVVRPGQTPFTALSDAVDGLWRRLRRRFSRAARRQAVSAYANSPKQIST